MTHSVYFLTRYGLANPDPEWHKRRLEMFKRFYLPSFMNQTNQDFNCLFRIDHTMPEQSIRDLQDVLPDSRFEIVKKWGDLRGHIFVRMDSDDAIATDFVEKTYELSEPGKMLNFNDGYLWRNNMFFPYRSDSNMFLSVWDDKGPYFDQHGWMKNSFEVVSVDGPPMWVHTYHEDTYTTQRGRNVKLNRKRAVEIDSTRFPIK